MVRFKDSDIISVQLRENCIQNFCLERYIVGYTDGNLVLWRVQNVISEHISDDIPPQKKILKMVIPILILQFCLKFDCCKKHKAACHPTICDVINAV